MTEPSIPERHEAMPQPAASTAQLVQDSTTTTIVLPPRGFKGMVRTMLVFALVWLAAISGFSLVFVSGITFVNGISWETIPAILIFVPFWAIGIGMLLGSIQSARRKSVFILSRSDGLIFSQAGPFRKSEKQWPAASITRIHMDRSGTVINNKPVMELQIHSMAQAPAGGISAASAAASPPAEKKDGMLSGRDEEELKWIASTLRAALAQFK